MHNYVRMYIITILLWRKKILIGANYFLDTVPTDIIRRITE